MKVILQCMCCISAYIFQREKSSNKVFIRTTNPGIGQSQYTVDRNTNQRNEQAKTNHRDILEIGSGD
jgi:hypothetical protein